MLLIDELFLQNSYFGRNMHKFYRKIAKIAQRWGLHPLTPFPHWKFLATPLLSVITLKVSLFYLEIISENLKSIVNRKCPNF